MLYIKNVKTNKVLWQNNSPGGCQMMRPLVKNKQKDTVENCVESMKAMEESIKNVKTTVITSRTGQKMRVNHIILHSMHDGKQRKAWAEQIVKQKASKGMVDLAKWKIAADACFTAFTEVFHHHIYPNHHHPFYPFHHFNISLQHLGEYKTMTANLHLLIAHGEDYIRWP